MRIFPSRVTAAISAFLLTTLVITNTSNAAPAVPQINLSANERIVQVKGSGYPASTAVQVTGSMAGGSGRTTVTTSATGTFAVRFSASPALPGGVTVQTAISGVASAAGNIDLNKGTTKTTGTRDIYAWPYAWNSIWNLPLAQSAVLADAGMDATKVYIDSENISIDPSFPLKMLTGGSVDNDPGVTMQVHVDPELDADGSWNNCTVFLTSAADKITVIEGQPLTLSKGGDPKWDDTQPTAKLNGLGITGCHGGSGLAGLGGDIRGGELPSTLPIRHAVKVGLDCMTTCSQANDGHRWPATKHDGGWNEPGSGNYYGGKNPQVQMGSLLALPRNADLSFITQPDVRKVAVAMQTYGAYVVDTTATEKTASVDVQHGYEDEFPNVGSDQMAKVIQMLMVVTNNTQATPGGGALGTPRVAACAPPFKDGTGGAPPGC